MHTKHSVELRVLQDLYPIATLCHLSQKSVCGGGLAVPLVEEANTAIASREHVCSSRKNLRYDDGCSVVSDADGLAEVSNVSNNC